MIPLLAQIDYRASSGRSPWHAASALGKLLVAAVAVGAAVFAPHLPAVLAVHAVVAILVMTAGLPASLVFAAAGYPLLFSALFALSRLDGTWGTPLLVVLRPLAASLAAAWLVGTTPYPDLFAPLSRLLPRRTGDSLFLTYRALFALLARADRMVVALRLRGGLQGPVRRRLRVAGEGLGLLAVQGFERSHRLYHTMLLRGHSGRICGCRHYADPGPADRWVAVAGVVLLALVVATWRLG